MSLPNLSNNIIQQQQNIVINQVPPITHTIMTTGGPNNGIPIATAISNSVQHQQHSLIEHQVGDVKTGIMMDTNMPMPGANLVNVQTPATSNPISNQNAHQSSSSSSKAMHNATNSLGSSGSGVSGGDSLQVLSKTRMSDLIRDIDPNIYMEDEVEEILLGYVDDFVDRVINGASIIAKHRHVKNIEVKDVQMFINRNYNMWAPGLGTDELRPYKRSLTTESHKQRLALIRKALKKY